MHPDGRGRAVASSRTGAMLFVGYRVRHAAMPGEAKPTIGIIAAIAPDGDRVAVTWPTGDTTWHRGCNLIRMGSVSINEQYPETKAGYLKPPDPIPVLWCGNLDQHPGHVWRHGRDEAWCDGANADGTIPYDPQRPGYEPPPPPPPPPPESPPESPPAEPAPESPLSLLATIAREVQAHLTLHASYGPEAIRHPEPDWTCQLAWATSDPAEPVLAYFGTGASLVEAAARVVEQITDAIAALPDPQEDTP